MGVENLLAGRLVSPYCDYRSNMIDFITGLSAQWMVYESSAAAGDMDVLLVLAVFLPGVGDLDRGDPAVGLGIVGIDPQVEHHGGVALPAGEADQYRPRAGGYFVHDQVLAVAGRRAVERADGGVAFAAVEGGFDRPAIAERRGQR